MDNRLIMFLFLLKVIAFQCLNLGGKSHLTSTDIIFHSTLYLVAQRTRAKVKTLKKAIVDFVPRNRQCRVRIELAFVPLCRVRRLQDLTILHPYDPSVLNAKINDGCAAMIAEFKSRDICKNL